MMDRPVLRAYGLIGELYLAIHDRPVGEQYPGGCWEHAVDDRWFVALNGHEEPMQAAGPEEELPPVTVNPYEVTVWFNGFPAGSMNPFQGVLAAGAAANEDTFCEAVERAIAQARSENPKEDSDQ